MCKTNEPPKSDGSSPGCRFGGACDRCISSIARTTKLLRVEDHNPRVDTRNARARS